MSFVSYSYLLLFGSCFLLYYSLRRRSQNILLLLASYVFYASWDYRFLSLLWLSTITDYVAGHGIQKARDNQNKWGQVVWVTISVVVNLGVLGFFKYYGFFASGAQVLLNSIGLKASLPTLEIILPVGISFYTFQTLSYSIDIYRGVLKPTRSFIDFAVFVAFFPQLVAGPIERARNLLPQFERRRVVTAQDMQQGIWLILIGYFRKIVIADTAAFYVDKYFEAPDQFSSIQLWCGLMLFSLQIYGDFSGYSNIARGCARLLGIDLMRNFMHPYFARNVSDFWRRWHISLSTWLRDYLYIPLGGNRKGSYRTYYNLMVTMLLGGLWHGASWNFVIWGALHGIYLSIHRKWRDTGTRLMQHMPRVAALVYTLVATVATFCLVTLTWLFFRSTTTELTFQYLFGLLQFSFDGAADLTIVAILAALVLFIDLPQAVSRDEYILVQWPRFVRLPVAAAILTFMLFSQNNGEPFIYFQF